MKGTFVSVWDNGSEIHTNAVLDVETGEVSADTVYAPPDLNSLDREYFESNEFFNSGEEFEVCTECHEYIMKTVMVDGIGCCLYEVNVCSNPDCVNGNPY